MHRVIDISLAGHPAPFRLHDDAYDMLQRYLEDARSGLADEADLAEVIDDLERSIGEKLTAGLNDDGRVVSSTQMRSVLDEMGTVEPGTPPLSAPTPAAPGTGRRRLLRIRKGQEVAGVCNGLAEYSGSNLTLVRWIFALLTIFTGGLFGLVYLVAMFILPIVETHADFRAAQPIAKVA